jgi:integrase
MAMKTDSRAKGSVHWEPATRRRPGHYKFRLSLEDGSRPWVHLDPTARSTLAEARAREVAQERSDQARRDHLRGEDFDLGPRQPRTKDVPRATGQTMDAWLKDWFASRRSKGLTSVRENEAHVRKHIAPTMGDKHVRDWTSDDMRKLAAALDATVQAGAISWKTAWNVWATASRICRDACASKVEALRVRADNPARDVEGPDRGASKAKQFLYPNEFLAFARHEDVPLAWRRHVALAIYLFPRAGELRVLRWEDVDLVHGTIHVHRAHDRTSETGATKSTKTGHARRFAIEPQLLPLLEAMRVESGGEGLVVNLPSERALARGLRRWLWKANVRRSELHLSTGSSRSIVFHDLRATGATWMAVRGDEAMKIMQRCGHENIDTTMGYVRTAEAVREGFGGVFPPLPDVLLGSPDSSEVSELLSGLDSAILSARNASGVDGTRKPSRERTIHR